MKNNELIIRPKILFIHISIILSISLGIAFLLIHIKNEIAFQIPKDIDDSNTPEELLNHANTMYWYGRAIGNTSVEFEQAAELARMAKDKIQDFTDSNALVLVSKANQIIYNAECGREQNKLSVNNKYPYFLDLMGLNEIKEEDQMKENLDRVTTARVVKKLMDAPDLLSSRPLRDVPYFTILIHETGDVELEEAGIQYLNLTTNHYTISRHEIAQIAGTEDYNLMRLLEDSVFLEKVREYFHCGQVGIIHVIKQDQYRGVFYYGARFELYAPGTGRKDLNRYVEAFTTARGYNTMTGIKIPLLIIYLLILMLGMEILLLLRFFDLERVKWHRLLLTGVVAILINVAVLEALAYFWSPESGEFIETDRAMVWIFGVALSFTLFPIVLGHLAVGKLDQFITSFDSGLDDRAGLFSIILPTLSTYGIAAAYYSLLRFGFSWDLISSVFAFGAALILSVILTLYWKRLKELPAKTSLFRKIMVYAVLIFAAFGSLMYPYNALGIQGIDELSAAFITYSVLPAFAAILWELLSKLQCFRKKNYLLFWNNKNLNHPHRIAFQEEQAMVDSLTSSGLLVVYGAKKMGKSTLVERLKDRILKEQEIENLFVIDLALRQKEDEKNKINYYPFAEGFAHELPYSAFNDHAEEARRSGNIIGKLISSITSVGDLLVDESDSNPADLTKIKGVLIKKLCEKKSTMVIFENMHAAIDENRELFLSLIEDLYERNINTDQSAVSTFPLLVFTSIQGFHIKSEFELLIEDLLNSRKSQIDTNLSGLKESQKLKKMPYFELVMEQDFLSKYLDSYKFNVFDKKYLMDRFKSSEKDKSPGVVDEVFEKLLDGKRLKGNDQMGYKIEKENGELMIPEIIDELDAFESVLKSVEKELYEILRCCAYCSVRNGEFEIGAVSNLLEKSRIEILHALKTAEDLNIVYDLKEREDWYCFNDTRFDAVLKRKEGKEFNEITQLGKEFYQRWVSYYWSKFHELSKNVKSNKDLLIALCDRSYLIREIDPLRSLEILEKLGYLFLSQEVSLLEQAEKAFTTAIKIVEEHSDLFDEKKIYDLKVNGLLRTLDGKNELNTSKAEEILTKDKEKIRDLCPEFLLQLEYLSCLAYSKSKEYHPEVAKAMIKANLEIMASRPMNDITRVQFEFVNLLLHPTGKATIDEIITLSKSYEELIQRMENDENLLLKAKVSGVYQQLLNHFGGNILSDKILGSKDYSQLIEQKRVYFIKATRLLFKRLAMELSKISEKDVKTLETDPEKLIPSLYNILVILSEDGNDYAVDRKGLSYTFNYLTRSIYYLYTINGTTSLPEDLKVRDTIIRVAEFALGLNNEVNDQAGVIMASSYLGLIRASVGNYKEAFECYEEAFTYALALGNDWQLGMTISNMEKLFNGGINTNLQSSRGLDGSEKKKFEEYQRIKLERHLIRHFNVESFNDVDLQDLNRRSVVLSKQDLIDLTKTVGSKFDSRLFSRPKDLIGFLDKLVALHQNEIIFKGGSNCLEIDLGQKVGVSGIISLTNLPADSEIVMEGREGYQIFTVKNIPAPETNWLFIALAKDRKTILTAAPGHFAPKFPDQIGSSNKEDYDASKLFWSTHAFVK